MIEFRQESTYMDPVVISGSHTEVGKQLGRIALPIMKTYLSQSDTWKELERWKGSSFLKELGDNTKKLFSHIWEELEGMASELCMEVQDLLLWNCRGDFLHKTYDGCTSIAISEHNHHWLAHNEDGDPFLNGKCHIVDIRYSERGGKQTGFISFYYPGSLPGHTFAVNRHGIVQTINNLRIIPTLKEVGTSSLPRMVLARAVLDASTLPEAVGVLENHYSGGGFHHTLCAARGNGVFVNDKLILPEVSSVANGHRLSINSENQQPVAQATKSVSGQTTGEGQPFMMVSVEKVLNTCSVKGIGTMVHTNHTTHPNNVVKMDCTTTVDTGVCVGGDRKRSKTESNTKGKSFEEITTPSSLQRYLHAENILVESFPVWHSPVVASGSASSSSCCASAQDIESPIKTALLTALRDECNSTQANEPLTILRTSPTDPDGENTLATVLIYVPPSRIPDSVHVCVYY